MQCCVLGSLWFLYKYLDGLCSQMGGWANNLTRNGESCYKNDNNTATQQKMVFVNEVGEAVELGEREIPQPGKHQVLIKMRAPKANRLVCIF